MTTSPRSREAQPPASAHRPRPTLEQVAEHAGVSRATVSRVVNHATTVDHRLVEVVRASIEELGYVPNPAARSLVTRRSDLASLLVTETDTRVFSDPFFATIVRGLSGELNAAGMDLVLNIAQTPEGVDRVEGFLARGLLDGALVISEHDGHDVVRRALRTGIPLVMGGRPFDPDLELPYVDNDNVRGAALAARHLRERGARRVATIAGPQDMVAGLDRLAGFRAGMGSQFDPALVEVSDFTTSGAAAALRRLLERAPDLDGLFAASDMMALGALEVLAALGRDVPGDVAVVGFDDAEVAAEATPALTTVRQRTLDQGRLMAQMLLHRLGRPVAEPMPELARDPDSSSFLLDVELVVRESA